MCVQLCMRPNRFKQPTIWFETEDKNGYPYHMFISPKYTWSDRLQAGLSCGSLLLIIGGKMVQDCVFARSSEFQFGVWG